MAQVITDLTGAMTCQIAFDAADPQTAASLPPLVQTMSAAFQAVFNDTANVGNVANAIDQCYANLANIPASGNAQIDLTSFTNVLNHSGASFARVKAIAIVNLSVLQDSGNGGNSTNIVIGANGTNDWGSQTASPGWFGNVNSNLVIPNGGMLFFGVNNAAGVIANATKKIVNFINNDSGNVAKVLTVILGGNI